MTSPDLTFTMHPRPPEEAPRLGDVMPSPPLVVPPPFAEGAASYRVKVGKQRFAAMPAAERKLLILLGHATNEIMLFNKMLLTMSSSVDVKPKSSADYAHAGKAFILLRDLIGKLCEAQTLYKKRFLHDRNLKQKYISRLSQDAIRADNELGKQFKDGVLRKIRNSFSYHYYDDEDKFERAFKVIPDTELWELFLGERDGDCFYFVSEMVAQYAVLQDVKPVSSDEEPEKWLFAAFAEFSSRAIAASGSITMLFGELIALLITANMAGLQAEPEMAAGIETR